MRWRAVVCACTLAFAGVFATPAQADVSSVDVPVTIPTPVSSVAPASPLPAGSGISSSDWSFQTAPVAGWLDGLAQQLFAVFGAIMNKSIALAQVLFYALAVAEFGFALGRWAVSNTPLEEVVAAAYVKAVQMGLLYIIIGSTFTVPGGGPGWFPLIVSGIIGMAQDAAGVSVISNFQLSSSLQLAPGMTPGDVFTFFWNIAVFVMKAAFTQETITGLLVGAFTGATAIWIVTALLSAISALGILSLGCYVSFKYFLTLLKAYLVASQAYLQGFLGSTKTASNGSGLFNAALNLGIEMGALVIVVGVFKSFLTLALGAMSLGFLVAGDASSFGSQLGTQMTMPIVQSVTNEGVRLVAVLLLDALVILWAYAVKTLPEWAASALSGRLDVRPEEAIAHAFSSSAVVKTASTAAAVAGGAVGVKMLAGVAAGGAGATFVDRAAGAARGALQGGLLAGGPGAFGGAFVGAVQARSGSSAAATEGTIAGGGGSVDAPFANREFAPKSRPAAPNEHGATGPAAAEEAVAEADRTAAGRPAGTRGAAGGSGSRASGGGGAVVDGSEATVSRGADRVKDDGAAGAGGRPSTRARSEVSTPPGDRASAHLDGAEVLISRSADRATTSGDGGGADAGGLEDDAQESGRGFESTSGGSYDNTRTATGGFQKGASRGAAQEGSDTNAMRDLTSALRDTTAALRAHRFGGGPSAGAPGSNGGTSGGGNAGRDDQTGGGFTDPIFGGGRPMNPLNIMLYRKLLSAGAPPPPRIQPEHPTATVDAGSLVG